MSTLLQATLGICAIVSTSCIFSTFIYFVRFVESYDGTRQDKSYAKWLKDHPQ